MTGLSFRPNFCGGVVIDGFYEDSDFTWFYFTSPNWVQPKCLAKRIGGPIDSYPVSADGFFFRHPPQNLFYTVDQAQFQINYTLSMQNWANRISDLAIKYQIEWLFFFFKNSVAILIASQSVSAAFHSNLLGISFYRFKYYLYYYQFSRMHKPIIGP